MRCLATGLRGAIVSSVLLSLAACGGGSGSSTSSSDTTEVSGTIGIEAHTRVDADTADQAELGGFSLLNNDNAHPQELASPVILAGYLSDSGGSYPAITDSNGKSLVFNYVADPRDLFRLNLTPDQVVTLQVFASRASSSYAANIDVTAALTTDSTSPYVIASKQTDGSTALKLQLPTGYNTGTYRLDLRIASGGPVRYVLTVSTQASTASQPVSWDQGDFLPDQALVKMSGASAQASIQSAYNALNIATASTVGRNLVRVYRVPPGIARVYSAADRSQARKKTIKWIRRLRSNPHVAVAEPNYLFHATATSPANEPLYPYQWNMPLINMPAAWQLEPDAGKGVTVAVLDTGIYRDLVTGLWHPDLNANVVDGYDWVNSNLDYDSQISGEPFGPSGPDSNAADPGSGTSYHGTHVAGIIGAADNGLGVAGVAYQSNIMPVRVLGEGGVGSASDIINAISWVDNGGQPRANIINMSFGGLSPSSLLNDAVNRAVNDGIVIVAAAGNGAASSPDYPAALGNVVAVGAVDGASRLASYSNYGPWVDLVAPGGDALRDANGDGRADLIVSTWADDSSGTATPGYAGMQGTSMASPHVAGVLAMMDAVAATPFTYARFQQALIAGGLTDDLGAPGRDDTYGYGLINAAKAVHTAASGVLPTVLSPAPSIVFFNGSATTQVLTLTSLGTDPISGVQASIPVVDRSWLSVSPTNPPDGQQSYSLTLAVQTAQLAANQSYRSEVDIQYTSSGATRTLTVPVVVSLADDASLRNAGTLFVMLTRKDQDNKSVVVQQQVVTPVNGEYHFDFTGVAPGEYELQAGSDLDNDGYVCTSAEACAEYPALGSVEPIQVGSTPVTGLQMTAGYTRPVAAAGSLPRPAFEGYLRDGGGSGAALRQSGGSSAKP